ncbi:hypothetical protein SY83_06510 [Paenibacillus swuensis]|uniref:Uncharacterized protein n=1 Tax=Paenibacillus swuensis TaxID=1178515 RepID=A0A172TGS7_9BACL|nr:hypothetical protein [Paenibacillus swuensis]ANE45993.1 hypothetical protein SY83_06510 [Paenibacillus swuensis]
MYFNGQVLNADRQFTDHCEHEVPVQVYYDKQHYDIGYVQKVNPAFIKINNIFYNRNQFTFISRPGF